MLYKEIEWLNSSKFNGVAVGTPTTDGVLYYDKYYQSTKWIHSENDPCPTGFRVPTQDEWERLGAYECNPGSAGGYFTTNNVSGTPTGKGLTWVPVVCNTGDYPGRCFPSTGWTANTTSSGYAIYETAEWEAAINTGVYKDWDKTTSGFNIKNADNTTYKYPSLHEEATAPDPLLFLPAAGYRGNDSSTVSNAGDYGRYWSSTVYDTYARYLAFVSVSVGSLYPNSYRAVGFSIRCLVE